MSIIIVAGPLANKPYNGGGAWERMSWVLGLRRLGFDVYFVEEIGPQACMDLSGRGTDFATCVNRQWYSSVTQWFGLAAHSALVFAGGEQCAGIGWERLQEIAESAVLLVNLSGHLTLPALLDRIRRKVYVDVDPGFTQFWHASPTTTFRLPRHDLYFTIGENIGSEHCCIPTSDIPWRTIRQPVVLDDWPVAGAAARGAFTTIASWRGPFGPVQHAGRTYGLKVHEFRKFITLPQCVSHRFEIALDIHASDDRDHRALVAHGWRLADPRKVAADPADFRAYVQRSAAEFSVAQGIYVDTHSGWFSERTVRYLASGKPALVQDTGFSRNYPVGEGLVPFCTLEEAVAGAQRIIADYDKHCRTARAIAEEYFDSDKVLGRFLEEVGVAP
jgi:hypothetical protein